MHPAEPMDCPLLKLYVDSTSLPLVHQMADFVRCADNPSVTQLITWLRLPLSKDQLAGTNARYVPQLAAVNAAFTNEVVQLVQRGHRQVEIHSNQYHAWRGVAPLIRALAPGLRSGEVTLRLHLYDDGSIGLLHRDELSQWVDLPQALDHAAKELENHLLDGHALAWNLAHSHAWHKVLPTTYHHLHPLAPLDLPGGQTLIELLESHTEPLRFDGFPKLNEHERARYLSLFGLNDAVLQQLAPIAGAPDMLLFTGTGAWDKAWNLRLHAQQLRAIDVLQRHQCFDGLRAICFKGHPANGDHDAKLCAALGTKVITLPPKVPLEVLLMAGLLPQHMAGVLGSFHCSVPPSMIQAVICQAGPPLGGTSQPLVNWLLRHQIITPAQLLPLLD